jgi:glutaredoxin
MEVKMKKIIGVILTLFVMIMVPSVVLADSDVVTKTGLKEVIAEEISNFGDSATYADEINTLKNTDISSYSESDDKINIYVFRGNTCSHCLEAIVYFTSLVPEYGKYFNLITYETWTNTANANLMKQVASVIGDSPSGVPYIVIGDKSFLGYTSAMNDQITTQIMAAYNAEEHYDVMNHLNETSTKNNDSKAIVVIMVIMVIIAGGALIYFVMKK